MRRSYLRKQGTSETSKLKRDIQKLLREIKLKEQGDCWVKFMQLFGSFGLCDGPLQYDHLETRGKNISYADSRLGVLACRRHHYFHNAPRRELNVMYEAEVRKFIGEKRAKLWDRVRADNKPYPMGAHEWGKVILGLRQELKELEK